MSNTVVPTVYGHIMKEVLNNAQKEFEENGIDLTVLQELEKLWETKLSNSNVADFNAFVPRVISTSNPAPPGPGEDTYSKYYDTISTQERTYPQASNSTSISYSSLMEPHPNVENYAAANLANLVNVNNTSSFPSHSNSAVTNDDLFTKRSAPAPYKPDYHNYSQDASFSNNNSEYYKDSKPTINRLPQLDGANDLPGMKNEKNINEDKVSREEADKILNKKIMEKYGNKNLNQLEGEGGEDDEEDDAINSDLDDSEEDEGEDGDKDSAEHIILCQYDKVSRTKNRWRCNLKDGIILVNGKEYLFSKATGEFQW
ncbi:hypothetical protein K502DRAFT_339057 [Neoconidiobolus thromboides FSU 785]|nr:hypothetical protein K502DRAFT_339057 [Neoconidiobolus thromboides FSU 785]